MIGNQLATCNSQHGPRKIVVKTSCKKKDSSQPPLAKYNLSVQFCIVRNVYRMSTQHLHFQVVTPFTSNFSCLLQPLFSSCYAAACTRLKKTGQSTQTSSRTSAHTAQARKCKIPQDAGTQTAQRGCLNGPSVFCQPAPETLPPFDAPF